MAKKSGKITAVKTATFKLHNPSKRKRGMLNYALLQNYLAYTKALRASQSLIERLVKEELAQREAEKSLPAKEKNTAKTKRKYQRTAELSKGINKTIRALPICSASKITRSIPGDLIGQVESHIALHDEQESVGLPTVQHITGIEDKYAQRLEACAGALTLEEETRSRDELLRISKAGKFRPLLYATSRVKDGFLFLRDDETSKYFIWLNLVPKTGEVVSFKSKTGCLFPVEFSREYQDQEFIQAAKPLTAKLLKRGDDFEVHITFEFETEAIVPETFLGVDRGIYNLASLAVVTKNGSIIERENIDGRDLRFVQKKFERLQRYKQKRGKPFTGRNRLHVADEAVHRTANAIVATAKAHRSQIIMENLCPMTSRGKKRKKSNFNRVLNRSQYQKLEKVLAYKMKIAGLPKVKSVHPGYTSQACPICGHISRDNREKVPSGDGFKMDVFRCFKCNHTDDSDLNAARNIALKRLWREGLSPALKTKTFGEVPEKKSFPEFLKVHAERREESACDLRQVGTFGRSGLDEQYEDGEVSPNVNVVRPRSGLNTPVRKNSLPKQAMVSPSDRNSRSHDVKNDVGPDG